MGRDRMQIGDSEVTRIIALPGDMYYTLLENALEPPSNQLARFLSSLKVIKGGIQLGPGQLPTDNNKLRVQFQQASLVGSSQIEEARDKEGFGAPRAHNLNAVYPTKCSSKAHGFQ